MTCLTTNAFRNFWYSFFYSFEIKLTTIKEYLHLYHEILVNYLLPHQHKQAKAVLKTYDKLLRLQLAAPSKRMRPSVRKLLAQGKIEIRSGQYVLSD